MYECPSSYALLHVVLPIIFVCKSNKWGGGRCCFIRVSEMLNIISLFLGRFYLSYCVYVICKLFLWGQKFFSQYFIGIKKNIVAILIMIYIGNSFPTFSFFKLCSMTFFPCEIRDQIYHPSLLWFLAEMLYFKSSSSASK